MVKPPIIDTVVASYVFLFRNFGHAVKMGWPYFAATMLMVGLYAYTTYATTTFLINITTHDEQVSEQLAAMTLRFTSLYIFFDLLYPFLLLLVSIVWVRAILYGVSDKNAFKIPKDLSLFISLVWYSIKVALLFLVILAPVAFLGSLLGSGLALWLFLLPAVIFICVVAIAISSLFIYIPAKINGENLSIFECWEILKGIRARFIVTQFLCIVPIFFIMSFSTLLSYGASPLAFAVIQFVFLVPCFFVHPFVLLSVMTAYYMWLKKNPNWREENEETYFPTSL